MLSFILDISFEGHILNIPTYTRVSKCYERDTSAISPAMSSSSLMTDGDDMAIGGGGKDEPTGGAVKVVGVDEGLIPPMTGGGGNAPNDFSGAAVEAEECVAATTQFTLD